MPNVIDQLFDKVQSDLGNYSPSSADIPKLDLQEDALSPLPGMEELGGIVLPLDQYESLGQVENLLSDGRRPVSGLDQEEILILEGGIREAGLDVLAFYKSRRDIDQYPYKGMWGIFYVECGIDLVASDIAITHPGYGNPRQLALEFLRQHELHHYETDVFALMVESVRGCHLYEPLRDIFRQHRTHSVEEAIANRRAWDWAKKASVGLGDYAFDFMKCQPNAYARFDEPLLDLQSDYAYSLIDRLFSSLLKPHPIARWVVSIPRSLLYRSLCPEYVIRAANLGKWIPSVFGFPPVRAIDDSETVVEKLTGKYVALKGIWEARKKMLLKNPMAKSLHFRLWNKKVSEWSVNVDGNFRAHLRNMGNGSWITWDLDTHPKMGHGK